MLTDPTRHHRNRWSLDALSRTDVMALLDSAHALKHADEAGTAQRPLCGKNLALISDHPDGWSSPFQRAATDLGARIAYLRPSPTPDEAARAARLLGRLYDAIDCEGLDAATLREIDRGSGVPVFDDLANESHPTRVLATLLELEDRSGLSLAGLRVAFLGDARRSRGDALLQAAALMGMEFRIGAPRSAWPDPQRLEHAMRVGRASGARLMLFESEAEATDRAHCVLDERQGAAAPTAAARYALQAVLLRALT